MNTQNLQKRKHTWFVRLAVPPHLRGAVGRRELIKTTKTHDLAVANRVKHAILADIQRELNTAQRNRELPPESADYVLAAARDAREAVNKGIACEGDAERDLAGAVKVDANMSHRRHRHE